MARGSRQPARHRPERRTDADDSRLYEIAEDSQGWTEDSLCKGMNDHKNLEVACMVCGHQSTENGCPNCMLVKMDELETSVNRLEETESELKQQLLACQIEKERMREALEFIGCRTNHEGLRMGSVRDECPICRAVDSALASSTPSTILEDLGKIVQALKPFTSGIDILPWGTIKAALTVELAKCLTGYNYAADEALTLATKLGLGKGGE